MDPSANISEPEEVYVLDPQLSTTIEARCRPLPWKEDGIMECSQLFFGCGNQYRVELSELEYSAGNYLIARCPRCGKENQLFDREALGLSMERYREIKRLAKKNRRRRRSHLYQRLGDLATDYIVEHSMWQNIVAVLLLCVLLSLIISPILQYLILGYTTFW